MSQSKTKILLLGATGYDASNDQQSLRSVSWTVENFPNPRDFDIVVICLLGLDPSTVNWRSFHDSFHHKATRDILFNRGRIVVVGDPRFGIPPVNDNGLHGITFPFLNWTGLDFEWDGHSGDTLSFSNDKKHERYREYSKQLRSWQYSLASCAQKPKETPARKARENYYEQLMIDGWLTNRYQHPIGFDVLLSYGRDVYIDQYRGSEFRVEKAGRIVFLPPLEISADETIRMVLRDICGLDAGAKEPEWVVDMLAPGQSDIDTKIDSVSLEIEALQESMTKLRADREHARICLKLLYEREFVLEPIVLSILAALGAQVEEPSVKNKEDGWITVTVSNSVFEGVLEIKSTRKDHFTEDGRKQTVDWVQKGISEREKKYKGIFIGNSAVDKPINSRVNPFSESWAKAARLSEICAFTTAQLFLAYELDCRGELDRDAFWKAIFECNGVCSFTGVL